MEHEKIIQLDFEVDKLTNSIENTISKEVFDTIVTKIAQKDIKQIKKVEWTSELKNESKQVFKLTSVNNQNIIHGLISITDKKDHVFMDLIESAKFNKGKNKLYNGVAGNLVAFACKMSFDLNYDGIVSFVAKAALINHYKETLGAKIFGGNRMFIDTNEAYVLTKKYFKDFEL